MDSSYNSFSYHNIWSGYYISSYWSYSHVSGYVLFQKKDTRREQLIEEHLERIELDKLIVDKITDVKTLNKELNVFEKLSQDEDFKETYGEYKTGIFELYAKIKQLEGDIETTKNNKKLSNLLFVIYIMSCVLNRVGRKNELESGYL